MNGADILRIKEPIDKVAHHRQICVHLHTNLQPIFLHAVRVLLPLWWVFKSRRTELEAGVVIVVDVRDFLRAVMDFGENDFGSGARRGL